jgi:hypothetical protein
LKGNANFGAVEEDGAKGSSIEELKEQSGLHYEGEGKIVVLDPYEWKTGWKLPLISL